MSFGKKWIAAALTAVMLAASLSAPLTSLTAMAEETVFMGDIGMDAEDGLLVEDGLEETDAADAVFETAEMSETAAEGRTEETAAEIPAMHVSGTDDSADTAAPAAGVSAGEEKTDAAGIPAESADSTDPADSTGQKDEVTVETLDQSSGEAAPEQDHADTDQEMYDSGLLPEETEEEVVNLEDGAGPDTAEPVEESTEGAEDLQKDPSSSDSDASGAGQNEFPDGTDSVTDSDPDVPAEDGGEIFFTDLDDNGESAGAASSAPQEREGEAAVTEDPSVTEPDRADFLTGDPAMEEGEEIPDGLLITEEGISETWVPVEDGIEDADNEDVFAAYVNREMGLDGDLKADTGDYLVSEPRKKSNYVSRTLSEYNLKVYAVLLKQIKEVAAGKRTDTIFTVTPGDLGLQDRVWTAEDLGVDTVVVYNSETDKYSIAAEAKEAMYSLLGISFRTVNKALLADCPYDLYWYDKTFGSNASSFTISGKSSGGVWRLFFTGQYTFKFPVASEYSAAGEEGTYKTNSSIGQAVETACANALSIVNRYAGCSDYEKLDGYRAEICDLTSYNRSAADDTTDTPYGNPWQLIWTFDGDESTKVVCEGYAKSFQYLCDLSSWSDIFKECISVSGSMNGGTGAGGHMWNIVTLRDNRNYLVDVTNCDSGTIGAGNNGRNLFLVGTGDASSTEVFAQGNAAEGYTFAKLRNLYYAYDSDSAQRFGKTVLTLSPGRVDAATTAEGEYTGSHDHIYLPAEAKAATCTEEGHSEGEECVICGEINPRTTTVIAKIPHTPGTWTVLIAPSYDAPGEEGTNCTVCGEPLTREIPAWISESEISLSDTQLTLHKGNSKSITVTVLPAEAHDKSVTWTSDNEAVAAVSSAGKVTAVGNGTTTIHAATNHLGLNASCQVTVTTPVTGVSLNKTEMELEAGTSDTIIANVLPSDATNRNVTWSSNATRIAVVDNTGKVTAKNEGKAVISAATVDGNYLAQCEVTVFPKPDGVYLSETTARIHKGGEYTLTATVIPADAYDKKVFWSSSDTSIATVTPNDESGSSAVIHAVEKGNATITVETEEGGYTAACAVEVVVPVTGVSLSQTEASLDKEGTLALNAIVAPADASDKSVTWTSSKPEVASVDESGLVTAVSGGSAEISAKTADGGFTAVCQVSVNVPLESVTLPQEQILVKRDETQKIDYQLVPSDATEKEILWSSDNPATAIAENGEVTGIESGTATITASKPDGTLLGDCTVRVIVPVEEIRLDTSSLKLWTGDSENIHYTIGPSGYSENINLSFSYLDAPSVYSGEKVFDLKTFAGGAEVDALAPGTGKITYTLETETGKTFTASCDVEVLQEISSFKLDRSALSLTVGDRQDLSAKVLPADASSRVVTWTSSDEKIVKVTPVNGGTLDLAAENTASIQAVSCGTATVQAVITEETKSGSVTHTETCAVTVDPVPLDKVLTEDGETSGITIASAGGLVYTGSALKPAVTVICGGKTLQQDVDYKVSYQNNTAAGTAKVIITGCGAYSGTFEKTFAIGKASQTVTASNVTKTYGDSTFTIRAESSGDGALSYGSANTEVAEINSESGQVTIRGAGKAQITIKAAETSNYAASANKTITITVNRRKLADSGVTAAPGTYTYNGKAQTPAVTVKSGTAVLQEDTDYTLTYDSNTNAGTAEIRVAGKGNYTGTVKKTFTIAPAAQTITAKAGASSIAAGKTTTVSITGAKGTKSYTSSNPAVATVTSAGKVTAKKVGTVKIKAAAAATANYKAASEEVTIKVVPAAAGKLTAANQAKGIKLTWAKVAGANGYILYRNNAKAKTITSGATLTWTDTAANTNGTKYVYKVVAKASTGTSPLSKSVTVYRIARPAIKSLKNDASRKMTVTWTKNAKSTGYQIQYALNSKFTSGRKTVSITKAGTVSKVIGNLTKGKKYYVRIRTVKKAGDHYDYSAWSPVKTVTISR